ncbi:C4-dicarboxylate ABC transporter permease [Desulfobacter hydrogenophilus]|uniref:C4-dicarboxylate ABC transporter permease n=1 Tax=Desulfobacter hydrogenophilus TaxID=2291 RepID=A0A328FD77_9BACT|nr:TRAP transporter small permease subunit [Desulfobacter hydrogenophilus]NDY72149.1 TRAP transporter small permease subunit [Desulfobacter hydrogenophilus]QBH14874.1 TRAP transporter small permease subunit [Desulfobacter hydrogenophilus]RAM01382.1 C4-dicarboxylate ABC transporter permease [Desulfobacter hydrogenophilus]
MELMNRIILIIEKIIAAIGKTAAWAIIPLMLIMVFEVVTRRILNHPTLWTFETSTQLYGFHFMILGAYTLQLGRHISVDIVVERFTKRTRAILDILLYLVFFFPFIIVLLIESTAFARESWRILETSFSVFAPPIYPIKTMIPLTALLLLLQGICMFYRKFIFVVKGVEL